MRAFVFVAATASVSSGFSIYKPISSRSLVSVRRALDTTQPLPDDTAPLKACLFREYTGFFSPMEFQFYEDDVLFQDPLTSLTGVLSYKANVDLLAGRTLLGSLLFRDAGIALHSVEDTGPGQVRTRWTLQLTMAVLPWSPTAYFSGVSDYDVAPGSGKVRGQKDYWDSINLVNGEYEKKPALTGVLDFVAQLSPWNPERRTQPPAGPPSTLAATAAALGGATAAAAAGVVAAANTCQKAETEAAFEATAAAAATAASAAAAAEFEAQQVRAAARNAALLSRLPYEILRRGRGYDVRRYPAAVLAVSAATTDATAAAAAVDEYLGGGNAGGARVVPFTPTLSAWPAGAPAGAPGALRVPIAHQRGPAAAAAAAVACPAPLPGAAVAVAPLVGAAAAAGAAGEAAARGFVVAVRRLPAAAAASAAGPPGGFAAACAALVEALAADGLTAAEAPAGSCDALRASYRGTAAAAAAEQQPEDVPEDEAWVLLSSHDWL